MNQQSKNGVANVQPQLLDDQIIFIDYGSKIVRSMRYNIQAGKFSAINSSVLSSHLIDDPIDSAVYTNSKKNDGEFLFLVNRNGTMAIFQSLQNENIAAWTPAITQGEFLRCASANGGGHFIIKRLINGVTKYYLERINVDAYMDCQVDKVITDPTTIIDGFDALEGRVVHVVADDRYVGDQQVVDGKITLKIAAHNLVSAGLHVDVRVRPMPEATPTQSGATLYSPKRINTVFIDYFETLGLVVDGVSVPELSYNELSSPPSLKTGVFKYTPSKGSTPDATYDITQSGPFPFTLRGIGSRVDF